MRYHTSTKLESIHGLIEQRRVHYDTFRLAIGHQPPKH